MIKPLANNEELFLHKYDGRDIMKIVIFGVGRIFEKRKAEVKSLAPEVEIVAYIDNNEALWGTYIDEVRVLAPTEVLSIRYDGIVLLSAKTDEMKSQLLSYGISTFKIWTWSLFIKHAQYGPMRFCTEFELDERRKKILLIGIHLNYDGSTMALFHAADALSDIEYDVVVAASGGNPELISEMSKQGYKLVLCPCLPYVHLEERNWMEQFDVILVNTLLMLPTVSELCRVQPVIWWIHECKDSYEWITKIYWEYAGKVDITNAYICGVSESAKNNFNTHYQQCVNEVMQYSIPDKYNSDSCNKIANDKIVFAVIGTICKRKAQKDFLKAVLALSNEEREQAEFWVIGKTDNDEYSQEVFKMLDEEPEIKLCGELTREEIEAAYEEIDVVVCTSLEETMSLVITEGMMFEKICIASNGTGMADYVEHGKNGFIYQASNVEELSHYMSYIIQNIEIVRS